MWLVARNERASSVSDIHAAPSSGWLQGRDSGLNYRPLSGRMNGDLGRGWLLYHTTAGCSLRPMMGSFSFD